MTQHHRQHFETLQEIRSIMERSSRFISLSGLSGVSAGIFALIGAGFASAYLGRWPFGQDDYYPFKLQELHRWGLTAWQFFLIDAVVVFIGALGSAVFFTTRKAKLKGQKIWDPLVQRLLINLAIPLTSGFIFILGLIYHGLVGLVAPAALIFYGLALVHASKYTLNDIRYLGAAEIVLGLIATFFIGYGLLCWALGFGILHIGYGWYMYRKYEQPTSN